MEDDLKPYLQRKRSPYYEEYTIHLDGLTILFHLYFYYKYPKIIQYLLF
jgi:hypothetical protein